MLKLDLPKRMLASCNECPDYDLCMACIVANKHGHHPGHSFTGDGPHSPTVQSLLAPGRNVRHHAICDNCEKVSNLVLHLEHFKR